MNSCANYDDKLSTLARYEGLSVHALLEACAMDSVSPGICRKPGCNYSAEVEPDQGAGWREACGAPTVVSALRLAGVV
jgi:hypothetical protein